MPEAGRARESTAPPRPCATSRAPGTRRCLGAAASPQWFAILAVGALALEDQRRGDDPVPVAPRPSLRLWYRLVMIPVFGLAVVALRMEGQGGGAAAGASPPDLHPPLYL